MPCSGTKFCHLGLAIPPIASFGLGAQMATRPSSSQRAQKRRRVSRWVLASQPSTLGGSECSCDLYQLAHQCHRLTQPPRLGTLWRSLRISGRVRVGHQEQGQSLRMRGRVSWLTCALSREGNTHVLGLSRGFPSALGVSCSFLERQLGST